jgi:5-oxopent-3-ene-1,2,5-tricarboxylate decarboxylase/2-hydroxyhepta-2,4-diene-1,7-dioate isomerase
MKHVRFAHEGRVITGTISHEVITEAGGREYHVDEVSVWLPPVMPQNIIALAINYADHASELGFKKPSEPVMFHKMNTSLIGHKAPIYYPDGATNMHYENEVAVVIGKVGRNIKHAYAMDYVSGYTIANDIVVRDFLSDYFRPPLRAKCYDTFGPIGPCFVDKEDIADIHNLNLRTFVNDKLCQEGNTRDMIFNIPDLIEYLSSFMTLQSGDMIWTGTPKGISKVFPGDTMCLEIEELGCLKNTVFADDRPKC